MDNCTETTRRWPDALADVSPEELEDFIAHADVCAYHGALLEDEDKEFQRAFRLAWLFGRGHIQEGEELERAAKVVRRQLERWGEAAPGGEARLKRVSLYNGRRSLAKWDCYSPDEKHIIDSVRLDPEAGLEIRGVAAGAGGLVKARLCSYPLAGVRHAGEKLVPLGYGYAVGLLVEEVKGDIYRIEFRCVAQEAPSREPAETKENSLSDTLGDLGGRLFILPPLALTAMLLMLGGTIAAMTLGLSSLSSVQANRRTEPGGGGGDRRSHKAGTKAKAGDEPVLARINPQPLMLKDGRPVLPEGEDVPGESLPQETRRTPAVAAEEKRPDLSAAKSLVRKSILDYKHGGVPRAAVRLARPAKAPDVHVRPRRVWQSERVILWALETYSPSGKTYVMFEVGANKELHKKLSRRIAASGGEVKDPDKVKLSVRDLPKVEVLLTRAETGVRLIFKTEVGNTPYKWGPYDGRRDGVMGASALDNALDTASAEVFPEIKELLTQQATHDAGGADKGGGNADPRIPLDTQMRLNLSRYKDATRGVGGVDG